MLGKHRKTMSLSSWSWLLSPEREANSCSLRYSEASWITSAVTKPQVEPVEIRGSIIFSIRVLECFDFTSAWEQVCREFNWLQAYERSIRINAALQRWTRQCAQLQARYGDWHFHLWPEIKRKQQKRFFVPFCLRLIQHCTTTQDPLLSLHYIPW